MYNLIQNTETRCFVNDVIYSRIVRVEGHSIFRVGVSRPGLF